MARAPKGRVYQGRNRRWYWRLTAANGEIQGPSQGYASKRNAVKGYEAAKRNFAVADLIVED